MPTSPPSALAVVVSALAVFVVGGVWYSPLAFGKRWQREVGLSDEALTRGHARAFGTAFVCALVAMTNLGFFIGGGATLGFSMFAAIAAGAGWVATGIATSYVFARRSWTLIAIDAGYHVVAYSVAGVVMGGMG